MKQQLEERGRYFTKAECQEVVQRVLAFTNGGYTAIKITSWLNGELRWARNRVNLASDRCNVEVRVVRIVERGVGGGGCTTNQIDDASLEGAVRAAERRRDDGGARANSWVNEFTDALESPELQTPNTSIWSDATAAVTGEARGHIARMLTEEAEAKGMLSAGYMEGRSGSYAFWSNEAARKGKAVPEMEYQRLTQAQCSMTVRHPRGTGSGWAGASSFDVAAVDGTALARRALDKCITSLDAVRIEPGRYTVILEPQAVGDLVGVLMDGDDRSGPLARKGNEDPYQPGPLFLAYDDVLRLGRSKLGLKIIDERISISHVPSDPLLGVVPRAGLQPATWIQNGVLTALHHLHEYAAEQRQRFAGDLYRPAFRMSGGDVSVEDMIASTKRGLLVTRFSGIDLLDKRSLLCTGATRDGLWLIENGKITKSVWNMRFTESPLFALNQVEQLGVPQPFFRPVRDPGTFKLTPAIVPTLKINDFSFTSLIDAV